MPITKEGLEKLKEELAHLEREEKPKNIRAIAEARSHGDISENAEYHAARKKLLLINRPKTSGVLSEKTTIPIR